MYIYKTARQNENEKYPTTLDFNRIANSRGLLDQKQQYSLSLLETGAEGEELFLDYLNKFGNQDWWLVKNWWLKHFGKFECDFVLFTRHKIYVFEIKNYQGIYSYENGSGYVNNREVPKSGVQQAKNASIKIQELCQKVDRSIEVQGVLVFISADNHVEIKSDIGNLDVVPRAQLLNYIKEIVYEEQRSNRKPLDPKKLITYCEKFETSPPNPLVPISPAQMKKARKGIYCARCQSYNITNTKLYVKCNCGLEESREEAVVRTICDYGVLNFESPLRREEILSFLNEQVSRTYLISIIYKHFRVSKNYRYTYFENKRLPYVKIKEDFQIDLPSTLYLNEKNLIKFIK